jgi:hypothetical protein
MEKPVLAYLGDPGLLPFHENTARFSRIITSMNQQFEQLRGCKEVPGEELTFYKDYLSRLKMLHIQDQSIRLQDGSLRTGARAFYLLNEGNAWAFGQCRNYELAVGQRQITLRVPVNLRSYSPEIKFEDLAVSESHGMCISKEEKLFGWGLVRDGSMPCDTDEHVLPFPT